jgi:hypothetical protein
MILSAQGMLSSAAEAGFGYSVDAAKLKRCLLKHIASDGSLPIVRRSGSASGALSRALPAM